MIIYLLNIVIFFTAQVSSIPIVDDSDSLLDIYSRRLVVFVVINKLREFYGQALSCLQNSSSFSYFLICLLCSDITALAKDRAYTHINLDEMTVHQVSLNFPFFYFCPFQLIIYVFEYKEKENYKWEHLCLSFTLCSFVEPMTPITLRQP
jgi:hypothetical protein